MLEPDELLLGKKISQTDQMTVNSPHIFEKPRFIAVFTKAPPQVLGPVPNVSQNAFFVVPSPPRSHNPEDHPLSAVDHWMCADQSYAV